MVVTGGGDDDIRLVADLVEANHAIALHRRLQRADRVDFGDPYGGAEAAKRLGLRAMLLRDTDDPDSFYVEYAERQVRDEAVTLAELAFRPREILSIRAYDLGHYRPFTG